MIKTLSIYQNDEYTYIVTEFCNEGSLRNLIDKSGKVPEETGLKILKNIVNGYKECIDKKVLHRDIKPENILIKDDVTKIADFGFSTDI